MPTLPPSRLLLKRPSLRVDNSCHKVTAKVPASEIACISKPAFSMAITMSPRMFPFTDFNKPTQVTLSQCGNSNGPSTNERDGHAPSTIDLRWMPANLRICKRARETSQKTHEQTAGNTERAGHNFAGAPSPTAFPEALCNPSMMASPREI